MTVIYKDDDICHIKHENRVSLCGLDVRGFKVSPAPWKIIKENYVCSECLSLAKFLENL